MAQKRHRHKQNMGVAHLPPSPISSHLVHSLFSSGSMALLPPLLLFAALSSVPAATAAVAPPAAMAAGWGRYAAMSVPEPTPVPLGILPRLALPEVMSPFRVRRDESDCGSLEESHPCHELGTIGSNHCCPNTHYCLFDPTTFLPGCCPLGSTCKGPCQPDELLCNSTITITLTSTLSSTLLPDDEDPTTTITTTITTTTLEPSCCPRQCDASTSFLCSNSASCCAFGAVCSGDTCQITTPTGTGAGIMSTATGENNNGVIPSGCSRTDEFLCPTDLGEGCCLIGQVCALVDEQPFCSAAPTGGLSSGAKAGIGAGAAIGGGFLVAVVTWGILSWRRNKRREKEGEGRVLAAEGRVIGSGSDDNADGQGGELRGLAVPGAGTGGRFSMGNRRMMGRRPVGGGRAMSERSRTSNRYYGPDAVAGPYTTREGEEVEHPGYYVGNTNGPPGGDGGGGAGGGRMGDVPHGPDDVVVPVEIDSRERGEGDDGLERHPVTGERVVSIKPFGGPVELPAVLVDDGDRSTGHQGVSARSSVGGGGGRGTGPAVLDFPTPSPFLGPDADHVVLDYLGLPSPEVSSSPSPREGDSGRPSPRTGGGMGRDGG